MLRNVHIKNMALIEEIEVYFEEGLNIMTGETGAGKSIILGSIMTALGGSTGKDMLREDAEYGLVELLFEMRNPETYSLLKAMELPVSEDNDLIISRRIYPNRAVNKINDEMVTVGKLKEAAGVLIDIHSQHEHQSLLKKSNHLHILDRFGKDKIETWKMKTAEAYDTYKRLVQEMDSQAVDEETRRRQLDFARFEVDEIEKADLRAGEEDELELKYRKMLNHRQIMEAISYVKQACGYEMPQSAGELISHALSEMDRAAGYDEDMKGLSEQLATIDSLLNDFNRELSDTMNGISFDEQEYREIEARLDLIHSLEAKYGKTIEDILTYRDEKQAEIDKYEEYDDYMKTLSENIQKARAVYDENAKSLSIYRKQEGEKLAYMIQEALKDLNFMDVRFQMLFEPKEEPSRDGMDDAYFRISTNIGEPLKPLWEVASGGELSRIMLAIKSCLAEEDSIETLIFDEIDVGISGRTAQMVSEKLSRIGRNHQVICISHLPQIAAMADVHYRIDKQVEHQKTITRIVKLNEEESVTEIARILGGVEITDTVLNSAAEMKDMAKRTKKY